MKQTLKEETERIKKIMGIKEDEMDDVNAMEGEMGDIKQTEPDATATDVFDPSDE